MSGDNNVYNEDWFASLPAEAQQEFNMLRDIAQALVTSPAVTFWSLESHEQVCVFCLASNKRKDDIRHTDACLFAKATRVLEAMRHAQR